MIEQNLCPNCNKPVLDTEEICPNCGAIIKVKRTQKQLTKKAIQNKPRNLMASAPQKGTNPRAARNAVSPRVQTEVSHQGQKKRRKPVSPRVQTEINANQKRRRPAEGQRRRPPSSRQYMHSAPDSDYSDGLSRPTRGQKIEKKTDVTMIVVIAGSVLAILIIIIALSQGVREEGGDRIDNPDYEVVSEEKIDPIHELYREETKNNYHLENGIELILRTDGRLSDAQCLQIINIYTKNLEMAENAIPIIGDEGKYLTWKKNGKVKIIFTRQQENKKFDDYFNRSFIVKY